MATDEEECFVHPQRAAAVGEDDYEVWEINAHVVGENGLGVNVARAWKNRGAGVDHYGQVEGLRAFVHGAQRTEAVAIFVGSEKLMRGMDF